MHIVPDADRAHVFDGKNLAEMRGRCLVAAATDDGASDADAGEPAGGVDFSRLVAGAADDVVADDHRADVASGGENPGAGTAAGNQRTSDGHVEDAGVGGENAGDR